MTVMLGEARGMVTLDISDLSSKVGIATAQLNSLDAAGSKGMGGFQNELARTGVSVDQLGYGLLGLGGALLAPMALGVKGAINLEQAFKDVEASLPKDDRGRMGELESMIVKIGASGQYSAGEIAMVTEELAKSGYEIDQILSGDPAEGFGNMAQAVSDLSSATGSGLGPAVSGISAAMAIWNPKVVDSAIALTDASRAADIFTVAANSSSADVSDIIAGMRNFGPAAAMVGVSFEDAAASVALFTNFGLKATDAGTSLTRAVTMLSDPTSEASGWMEKLAIAPFKDGKFIGLPALMDQMKAGMAGMSDETKLAALASIFGAEAMDVMGLSIMTGGDALRDITKEMAIHGTASEQARLRTETLKGAIERLVEGFMTMLAVLASGLIGPLTAFAKALDVVTSAIMKIPKPILAFVGVLITLAGVLATGAGAFLLITPRITQFLTTMRALSGMSGVLGGLASGFLRMGGAAGFLAGALRMLLLPLGMVFGAAILAYKNNFLGFADAVDTQVGRIKNAWEFVTGLFDAPVSSKARQEFEDFAGNIESVAGSGADGLDWFVLGPDGEKLGQIIESAKDKDGVITMQVRDPDGNMRTLVQNADGTTQWVIDVEVQDTKAVGRIERINTGLEGLKKVLDQKGLGFFNPIISGVQKALPLIGKFGGGVSRLGRWWSDFQSDFAGTRGNPMMSFWDRVQSAWNTSTMFNNPLGEWARAIPVNIGKAWNAFGDLAGRIPRIGKPIGAAFDWVSERATRLTDNFSLLRRLGLSPIEAGLGALGHVFPSLKGPIEAFSGAFGTIRGRVTDAFEAVTGKVGDVVDSFQFLRKMGYSPLEAATEALGYHFPLLGKGLDLVGTAATAVRGGIASATSWIGDKLTAGVGKASTFLGTFRQTWDLLGKSAGPIGPQMSTIEKILISLGDAFDSIGLGFVADIFYRLADAVEPAKAAVSGFFDTVKSVGGNLWDGLTSGLGAAWNKITSFFSELKRAWGRGMADDPSKDNGNVSETMQRGRGDFNLLEKAAFTLGAALQAVGLDKFGNALMTLAEKLNDVRGYFKLFSQNMDVNDKLLQWAMSLIAVFPGLQVPIVIVTVALFLLREAAELAWKGLKLLGGIALDGLKALGKMSWNGLKALGSLLMGPVGRGIDWVSGKVDTFTRRFQMLRRLGVGPVDSALLALRRTFPGLAGPIDLVRKGIDKLGLALFTAKSFVTGFIDALRNGTPLRFLKDALVSAGAALWDFAKGAGSALKNWALDVAIPKVTGWLSTLAGNAWDALKAAAGWTGNILANIGAWALDTAIPTVGGWLADLASNAWDALKAAAGWVNTKLEPTLDAWGLNVDKPTVMGWITDFFNNPWEALKTLWGGLADFRANIRDWYIDLAEPNLQSAIVSFDDWLSGKLGIEPPLRTKIAEWIATVAAPTLEKGAWEFTTLIIDLIGAAVVTIGANVWSLMMGKPTIVLGFDINEAFEDAVGNTVLWTADVLATLALKIENDPFSALKVSLLAAGAIMLAGLFITGGIGAVITLGVLLGLGALAVAVFNAVRNFFAEDDGARMKELKLRIGTIWGVLEGIPVVGKLFTAIRIFAQGVAWVVGKLLDFRNAMLDIGGPAETAVRAFEALYLGIGAVLGIMKLGGWGKAATQISPFVQQFMDVTGMKPTAVIKGPQAFLHGLERIAKFPFRLIFKPLDTLRDMFGVTGRAAQTGSQSFSLFSKRTGINFRLIGNIIKTTAGATKAVLGTFFDPLIWAFKKLVGARIATGFRKFIAFMNTDVVNAFKAPLRNIFGYTERIDKAGKVTDRFLHIFGRGKRMGPFVDELGMTVKRVDGLFDVLGRGFPRIIPGIVSGFNALAASLGNFRRNVISGIQGFGSAIANVAKATGRIFKSLFTGSWLKNPFLDDTLSFADPKTMAVGGWLDDIVRKVPGVGKALDGLFSLLDRGGARITSRFMAMPDIIPAARFSEAGRVLGPFMDELRPMGPMLDDLAPAANRFRQAFTSFGDNVLRVAKGAGGGIRSFFGSFGDELSKGIKNAGGLRQVGTYLRNLGPMGRLAATGIALLTGTALFKGGVLDGVIGGVKGIGSALSGAWNAISNSFQAGGIAGVLDLIITEAGQFFSSLPDKLANFVRNANWGAIATALLTALSFVMMGPWGLALGLLAPFLGPIIGDAIGGIVKIIDAFATGGMEAGFDTLREVTRNGIRSVGRGIESLGEFMIDVAGPISRIPVIGKPAAAALMWMGEGLQGFGQHLQAVAPQIADFVRNVSENLVEGLQDAWRGISKRMGPALGELFESFKDLGKPLKTLFSGLKDIFTGDFISGFKKLGSGALDLGKGILNLNGSFNKFVGAGLRGIGELGGALFDRLAGRFPALGDTFGRLGDIFSGVFDTIGNLSSALGNILQGNFSDAWDNIVDAAKSAGSAILAAMTLIPGLIIEVFQAIDWGGLWNGIKNAASSIDFGAIVSSIGSGIQRALGAIRVVGEIAIELLGNVIDGIGSMAGSAWDWIKENVGGWVSGLIDGAPAPVQRALSLIGNLVGSVADAISGAATSAWDWIKKTATAMAGWVKGLIDGDPKARSRNASILASLIGSVTDALSGGFSSVWDWIKDKLIGAAGWVGGLIGGNPASRDRNASIAMTLMGSVLDNLSSAATSAWDWIKGGITGWVSTLIGGDPDDRDRNATIATTLAGGLTDSLSGGFSGVWEWIKGKVTGWVHGLISRDPANRSRNASVITNILGSLGDVFADAFSGVWEWALDKLSGVGSWLAGAWDGVSHTITGVVNMNIVDGEVTDNTTQWVPNDNDGDGVPDNIPIILPDNDPSDDGVAKGPDPKAALGWTVLRNKIASVGGAYTGLVPVASTLNNVVKGQDASFRQFIPMIGELGTSWAGYSGAIQQVLPVMQSLSPAQVATMQTAMGLNTVIGNTPFNNYNAGWGTVTGAIAPVRPVLTAANADFLRTHGTVTTSTAGMNTSVVGNFGSMLGSTVASFGGMRGTATGESNTMYSNVTSAGSRLSAGLVGTIKGMGSSVLDRFGAMQRGGTSEADSLNKNAVSAGNRLSTGMTGAAGTMRSGVTSAFGNMRSGSEGHMGSMASTAGAKGSEMGNRLTSGANQGRSGVQGALGQIPGIISSIGGSAASVAFSVGANISNAMASGMRSALGAIQAAAAAMVSAAETALRAKAMIASPSRLFMTLGELLGKGVVRGVTNTLPQIIAAVKAMIAERELNAAYRSLQQRLSQSLPVTLKAKLEAISGDLKAYQGDNTPATIVDAALALDSIAASVAKGGWTPDLMAMVDRIILSLKAFQGDNTPKPIVDAALALEAIVQKERAMQAVLDRERQRKAYAEMEAARLAAANRATAGGTTTVNTYTTIYALKSEDWVRTVENAEAGARHAEEWEQPRALSQYVRGS